MNGTQITDIDFFNDTSHPRPGSSENPRHLTTSFMHPAEVMDDPRLTKTEKRAVLASWASDVQAVTGAPALRQLDNGAIVRVDDVLQALRALDGGRKFGQATSKASRSSAGLRIRFPTRLRPASWRKWPGDDDDPPPCPAMIMRPLGGPLCGGEAIDPGFALAA